MTSGLNLGAPLIFRCQTGLNKGQLTTRIIQPDSLSPKSPQASPATTYGAYGAYISPDHLSYGSARYGLPTFSADVPPRAALPVAPMDARKDERIQLGWPTFGSMDGDRSGWCVKAREILSQATIPIHRMPHQW